MPSSSTRLWKTSTTASAPRRTSPDDKVRLFSRTLDDITDSFPELIPALAAIGQDVILDGEVLAWRNGQALAFSELQKRLGRKKVSAALQRDVPVSYVAFDVLYAGGELVDRSSADGTRCNARRHL